MVLMRFGALLPKKRDKPVPQIEVPKKDDPNDVSPELLPIVTLLSAQQHRRYHEGVFMLYYDLNGDGKAGDRQWQEVYGILTGNQLAYWDASNLAKFKDLPEKLMETSSKPNYLNFTDAVFNAMTVLPAAKQLLENVIIVLTTLKNRYIIQLRSYELLRDWYLSLRLAVFEYQQLQEAYTGALLSARGLRLLDIKTILAEKRFNHEDWVKIRYGSGMAWRRCYAVIEPSLVRRKLFVHGRMLLYESDNVKKKNLIGVITEATLVTAVYPLLPLLIDQSTIMKLEGSINFKLPSVKSSKKNAADILNTSLFIMPEQHSSVPGFDTLIRFLIPLFDLFGLYGRPTRLKADRVDPNSLVFGLPTLPRVHYLNVSDLQVLAGLQQYLAWDAFQWRDNLKSILRKKLDQGYDGCGSSRGFLGAVSSLNSPRAISLSSPRLPSFPTEKPDKRLVSGPLPLLTEPLQPAGSRIVLESVLTRNDERQPGVLGPGTSKLSEGQFSRDNNNMNNLEVPADDMNNLEVRSDDDSGRKSVQLADIYYKYSKIQTPSDQFDDRNKILNGSVEQFDEDKLPTLIRKKSLINGGIYPRSEKHLIESDSDSDLDEEDENDSSDSMYQAEGPLDTGALKVPSYEGRDLSYSSVKSPTTQYSEFNKQFLKAVEHPEPQDLDRSLSDDSNSDSYSNSHSPPPVPKHDYATESAKQFPQLQQVQKMYTPQVVNNGSTQQMYPSATHIPHLHVNTDLMLDLQEPTTPVESQRPRYISSPNSSQNQQPWSSPKLAGQQLPLKQQQPAYPQGDYGNTQTHAPHRKPPQGYPQQQSPHQGSQQYSPQHRQAQSPQAYPQQQSRHQAPQQPLQYASQQQQAQQTRQAHAPQQQPQRVGQGYSQAPQMYQSSSDALREYGSSPPTVAPMSAFRVQPKQPPPGQYRQQPRQQPRQQQMQQQPPPPQGQQNAPYLRIDTRPPQGPASKYAPQNYPNQRQHLPQTQHAVSQQGKQQRPMQQNMPLQSQQQAMQQRAMQQQQAQYQQRQRPQHQSQQQNMPMHQYNIPPRPTLVQQQSALSIRLYDDSGQVYQFLVLPNLRQQQQQQQQQQNQQDPRYVQSQHPGYMRKY